MAANKALVSVIAKVTPLLPPTQVGSGGLLFVPIAH
jgi:hypothetical protein